MGLTNLSEGGSGGLQAGGLRNLSEISDIPDSAVLHFPMLNRSNSTIEEQLQDADATAQGTTNVSGTYWEDYAEDGDGVDDWIQLPTNVYGSDLAGSASVFFTIDADSNDLGSIDNFMYYIDSGGSALQVRTGARSTTGSINFNLLDDNGNNSEIYTTTDHFDGGAKRRIALIKRGDSGASDLEIWIDGSQQSTNTEDNASFSSFVDFDDSDSALLGDRPVDRRYADAIIDNVIYGDDEEDSDAIQTDYDNQPWS